VNVKKEFSQLTWNQAVADDCRQLVRLAIREDLERSHDWTTVALAPAEARGQAALVAREAGIVAGLAAEETALVVAHDAVNKTILCALLGLGPADIWAVKQGNGGVTVIDYPAGAAGQPLISCLNLTAHLGGVLDRTAAGAL